MEVNRDAVEFSETVLASREVSGFLIKDCLFTNQLQTKAHSHGNAYFSVVLAGNYFENVQRETRDCGATMATFHPIDEMHRSVLSPGGCREIIVDLTGEALNRIEQSVGVFAEPFESKDDQVIGIARRVHAELHRRDSASHLALEAAILELLAQAERVRRNRSEPGYPTWLRRVRDHLHDDPLRNVMVTELAEIAGVHGTHLARSFLKHHRCSVGEYVRRLRIEWACEELVKGHRSISEIAVAAGFYDQAHFSRVFKRYTGNTPARHRKRLVPADPSCPPPAKE